MKTADKITEIKHILTLIEGVDLSPDDVGIPADMEKLEEINARTWCVDNNKNYVSNTCTTVVYRRHDDTTTSRTYGYYTYSLDACTAIQEDWDSIVECYYATNKCPEGKEYIGFATRPHFERYHPHDISSWIDKVESPKLPTEPLARLYAVLLTKLWRYENE